MKARFSGLPPAYRTAATALLVAVGYYAGANLAFLLRLRPAVPSVLWPPNSILMATLLLTPRRRWWIYLLAAFPAHLAAELPAWSPALVLALFVTNCSEAVVGALFVRRFSDAPARVDTLRRVGIFILGAALFAPFVSSFLDAAAVASLRGDVYWTVWWTRFFSNVLTELTVASAILTTVCAIRDAVRPSRPRPRRRAEAALLSLLLLTVAIVVFTVGQGDLAGLRRSPMAWLLPMLLWAAVRFAPLGASLSLLTTAIVAIVGATHLRGPFVSPPVADHVPSLQVFLIILAIPLMCLAALIEERKRVQDQLSERLRFEAFLARLSAGFVHAPSDQIDGAIAAALRNLGEFLPVDRVVLLRFEPAHDALRVARSWTAPGFDPEPSAILARDCPVVAARLLEEKPFVFSRSTEGAVVPPGVDVRSSIAVPLLGTGRARGALAIESIASDRDGTWPEELVQRLGFVAEVFANVLARQEAEDALRGSELMKSAILSSLSSGVAVLDKGGRIIAVNESWSRLRADAQSTPYGGAVVGADYVELCSEAVRRGAPHAREMLAGTEQVLAGARGGFSFEYSSPGAKAERWFGISVAPLNRHEGGAVVSHTEVTERKRAEVQVQRSRQELAHFARVSAMGELTVSLAHEMRQPLTGIMTNAQAARRFLASSQPDLAELRGSLDDVISDTRRAADAIQRARDMLRNGDLCPARLDLNQLIDDVARLLGSDAIIRSVALSVEPARSPVVVLGDRVQLEQVILNLLMNAMDAMADIPEGQRTIVVRAESVDSKAHVVVEDAGPGLRGAIERLFEPFYTTKATGMGMGLSIARSIVEAHGGSIWATNNHTRGAAFHFSLPKLDERPS
ncbi:MAG: MASE1 domain-containing protein [Myxococcales bacterium]